MLEGWSFAALAGMLDQLPDSAEVAMVGSPAAFARLRAAAGVRPGPLWPRRCRAALSLCVAERLDIEAFPAVAFAHVDTAWTMPVIVGDRPILRFAPLGPLAELTCSITPENRWTRVTDLASWLSGNRRCDAVILAGVHNPLQLLVGARKLLETHAPLVAIDRRFAGRTSHASAERMVASLGHALIPPRAGDVAGAFSVLAQREPCGPAAVTGRNYRLAAAEIGLTGNLERIPGGSMMKWSGRSPGFSVVLDVPAGASRIALEWSSTPNAPVRFLIDGKEAAASVDGRCTVLSIPSAADGEFVVSVCPIRVSTTARLHWPDLASVAIA